MTGRLIWSEIWTSTNFNRLSCQAERHFFRMLDEADDYGCLQVTPGHIKGRCYPLKDGDEVPELVRKADIESWTNELVSAKIMQTWPKGERVFGIYLKFGAWQRCRLYQRKTPPPPARIVERLHYIMRNPVFKDKDGHLIDTFFDEFQRAGTLKLKKAQDKDNPRRARPPKQQSSGQYPDPDPDPDPDPQEEKKETAGTPAKLLEDQKGILGTFAKLYRKHHNQPWEAPVKYRREFFNLQKRWKTSNGTTEDDFISAFEAYCRSDADWHQGHSLHMFTANVTQWFEAAGCGGETGKGKYKDDVTSV